MTLQAPSVHEPHEPGGGILQVDRGGFRPRSAVSALLGLAALAAAAWLITLHRDEFRSAIGSIGRANPWLITMAILLPALNWVCTTATFWILTRRVGRVGFFEMGALMGSAWLANYLPLKPGLVARIAYHAAYNQISPIASARVIIQAVILSAASAGGLIILAIASGLAASRPLQLAILWAPAGVLAVLLCFAILHGRAIHRDRPGARASLARSMVAAFSFRGLDALTWVVRYLVAFELVGTPIGLVNATALAAVSQAVASLPVIGSVLGIREWAVGALSSVLPQRAAQATVELAGGSKVSIGLLADVVNRVIEVVWAVAAGVVCSAWIARRIAAGVHTPPPASPTTDSTRGGDVHP